MLFESRWHFLAADVLFGVHEPGGELLLAADGDRPPAFVCWTDTSTAAAQLPPGYRAVHARVRDVLPSLPRGVAVWVDPGTPDGTAVAAGDVEALAALCVPFPPGAPVSLGAFDPLPDGLREAMQAACRSHAFIQRIWVFLYAIENGPRSACVAWDGPLGQEPTEDAVGLIGQALDGAVRGTGWDAELGQIPVFRVEQLPDGVREWVLLQQPVAQAAA